jgi:tetratricopeptide (TPR) repeat protein
VPAALRAEALEVASYLATAAMDLEHAARLADRAEEAAEEGAEDIAARASARLARGRVMLVRRDPPGPTRAVLDEAAHLSRRAGLPRAEASAENLLGLLAGRERDFDAAEAHLARTQRLWEGAGRPERANHVRYNRAAVVSDRGDIERALALYGECLTAARAGGDRNLEAQIFNNLGVCHARAGRWAESLAAFAESIRRGHALGYTYSLAFALWNVAEPLAYTGRGAAGAAVLAFASRFWTDGGSALTDDDRGFCDRVYAEAARSLPNGPAELPARIAEGEALTLAGAVSLALSAADAAP